ncbi:unnamed protein product [Prorocentrum cordatum]|uniref:Uncharacterized protein n=1 Tax=Prorocentrum cordatum TaxID=2364126 RepID=A0ABN9PXX1_9DINO|nr:unnamed protein product [Polarella glacialis]
MNEYEYIYMKKRKEFGRYCQFEDVDAQVHAQIDSNPASGNLYIERTIINAVLDNIPELSEHSVNTARVQMQNQIMLHVEGGWPKEVDYLEAQDTLKFKKRLEKNPSYIQSVRDLTKRATECLEQNNTIDLFEVYFESQEPEHQPEAVTMKTTALFKDPAEEPRNITKICWNPEGPSKFIGSYSILKFQRMTDDMAMASFVWDVNERNVPLTELRTTSPLVCTQYNSKQPDLVVGGCYNASLYGLLHYYDLRKGPVPVAKSAVEATHYDPIYDVVWLQSKTGSDCASVSSDGRLLFWDVRNLSVTSDECVLTDGDKEDPKSSGGVSLEWMQEAGPSKFLVGTEQGTVISCSKKPKKNVEVSLWYGHEEKGGYGKHFGPIYSVKRNPFHVKYFMTVGDWCAKLWMEELKGPMLQTPYHDAYLSAASWSPTRPGVFFLCRQDGWLDAWDYYYRMNEVSLSHKVSESQLTSMRTCRAGVRWWPWGTPRAPSRCWSSALASSTRCRTRRTSSASCWSARRRGGEKLGDHQEAGRRDEEGHHGQGGPWQHDHGQGRVRDARKEFLRRGGTARTWAPSSPGRGTRAPASEGGGTLAVRTWARAARPQSGRARIGFPDSPPSPPVLPPFLGRPVRGCH